MPKPVALVATLTAVVAGIMLATSLSSSAQEEGGGATGDTTTTSTTVTPDVDRGHFGFRFDGELPPEIDEMVTCLGEQGIEIPERTDRSFHFELRGIEGLAEALETCGLPGFGTAFPFNLEEHFPFDGEPPEDFPFGDWPGPHRYPFPDGFGADSFPFRDMLPADRFGFDFKLDVPGLDRDELARCLAELGTFESVDEVRAQLDVCLPERPDRDDFDGFGGWFGFDFEDSTRDSSDSSA